MPFKTSVFFKALDIVCKYVGHILVNERKGIVYLLMESQFHTVEEKADKQGWMLEWKTKNVRELH